MQKQFVTIKELYRNKEEYIGKTVKVAGWIRTSRMSKNFGFIELNDGSFFKNMQIVIDEKLENFKEVGKYAAKDIEYDMQQDGVFNTVSVFAYPSEEQSKDKCIDALDHVHMDHTKKQCLQNVCAPERKSFSGKTVSQSTESQFFSNRRQQDDIQVCQSGGI